MKNYELINYKKKLIAFVVRNKLKRQKQNFWKLKKFITIWIYCKKKNDIILRHKHKELKEIFFGTSEILIVKKGETQLKLFKYGKLIKK